jgi:hypothetical protein
MSQLTSGTVTLAVFTDMLKRYNAYVTAKSAKPAVIYTVSGGSNYVTLAYFTVMLKNYNAYVAAYSAKPASINITTTVATYTTTTTTTDTTSFGIGYFINPSATALSGISWSGLKAKGITEVYVRILNSNYSSFATHLANIKAAGLKPYAWVWQGFSYTSYLVKQGWNMCMDMETYSMANYYTEIKAIQTLCKANSKTFILCTKAQDWDGAQQWATIRNYCDYIMPMLYLGDYGVSVTTLAAYMKKYNALYPGKIYPALETYVSDANVTAKTKAVLSAEIAAVKPYAKGVGLFRYGISNF